MQIYTNANLHKYKFTPTMVKPQAHTSREERESPKRNGDESASGGERVQGATRNGGGENKVNQVLAQKMRTPYGLTIGITSQNCQ
jgi:hypothetical protein